MDTNIINTAEKVNSEILDLLTAADICAILGISRNSFDYHKRDLFRFGLFQMNGAGSQYRMTRADLARYIESKKTNKP